MNHTPTPWNVAKDKNGRNTLIKAKTNNGIDQVIFAEPRSNDKALMRATSIVSNNCKSEREANVCYAVHCVNNLETLLESVKEFLELYTGVEAGAMFDTLEYTKSFGDLRRAFDKARNM